MSDEQLARARVAAGVAVLDGWDPDWRRLLDPDRLNMAAGWYDPTTASRCGCVAAQWAYVQRGIPDNEGLFHHGVQLLADERWDWDEPEKYRWAVDHGLMAEAHLGDVDVDVDDDPAVVEEYALLTRLWREELGGKEPRYG